MAGVYERWRATAAMARGARSIARMGLLLGGLHTGCVGHANLGNERGFDELDGGALLLGAAAAAASMLEVVLSVSADSDDCGACFELAASAPRGVPHNFTWQGTALSFEVDLYRRPIAGRFVPETEARSCASGAVCVQTARAASFSGRRLRSALLGSASASPSRRSTPT